MSVPEEASMRRRISGSTKLYSARNKAELTLLGELGDRGAVRLSGIMAMCLQRAFP